MEKLLSKTICLLCLCTLTACISEQPTRFGIPEAQWSRLTKEQQDEVIRGYNQRKATGTANEPIINANKAVSKAVAEDQRRKRQNTMPHFAPGFDRKPPPLPPLPRHLYNN